jgi:cell division protein FtsB
MIALGRNNVSVATSKLSEPKPSLKARAIARLYRTRRLLAIGLAVMLTLFFAYHVVFGLNGVNSYEQKRSQDRSLHQQLEALQQENDRLRDHVQHLESDPDAIEHEARKKLHYARPDEVIYTLSEGPPAASTSQSAASVQQ